MLQIVGVVAVIALVYALKAFAIVRGHEGLAFASSAFSWVRMREEDAETAAKWREAEEADARNAQRVTVPGMRPAGGARA